MVNNVIREVYAFLRLQKMKLENSLKECKEKFMEEQSLVLVTIDVMLMSFVHFYCCLKIVIGAHLMDFCQQLIT